MKNSNKPHNMNPQDNNKRPLLLRIRGWLGTKKETKKKTATEPRKTVTHSSQMEMETQDVETHVETKAPVIEANLLNAFPQGKNLVDAEPFNFDGGKHFVNFRRDRIIVDGKDHMITKRGDDADVTSVVRDGTIVTMTVNAHGKTSAIAFNEDELSTMLHDLAKRGVHESNGLNISRF